MLYRQIPALVRRLFLLRVIRALFLSYLRRLDIYISAWVKSLPPPTILDSITWETDIHSLLHGLLIVTQI